MRERLNLNRSGKSLFAKNYDLHYEKLLNIMHSQRKITLNNTTHIKKKSVRSHLHLTPNNVPITNCAQKNQVSIDKTTQKTKRVFDKSLFARSLFPNQHYFHITKSNKFVTQKQKDSQIKKMSNYNLKKIGKIVKIMLIIRFLDVKLYCKNSNFAVQIQPYGLRSPILAHSQLSKDAIGFKFKHRQNEDFFVSIFQIRGTNEHLLLRSNKKQDFDKFKLDVQTKVSKKKQSPAPPQIITQKAQFQDQQQKKFQLSTKCRISIDFSQKHDHIYSFSKERQKSHAQRTCIKDNYLDISRQKKKRMTNTNFFTDRNSNMFKQNQGSNIVLMKLD